MELVASSRSKKPRYREEVLQLLQNSQKLLSEGTEESLRVAHGSNLTAVMLFTLDMKELYDN